MNTGEPFVEVMAFRKAGTKTLKRPRIQPQRKPLGHPEFNHRGNAWATQNSTTEETLRPPRIQPQRKPLGHPEFNHRGNLWATQNYSTTEETLQLLTELGTLGPHEYPEFNHRGNAWATQNSTTEETLGPPRIQPKRDSWAHAEEARHIVNNPLNCSTISLSNT